jgi:translocation and assembly module TamA
MLTEHLDISRHASDANLPPEEIQRLIAITPEQIRGLVATEGYFSPAIRSDLDQSTSPWTVSVDIDLGEPARVSDVQITFRGGISAGPDADPRRMERLRRRWSLDPGAVFRQADWNEAKNALLKGLLVRDFPAATLAHSEARVDPRANTAALTVEVDSGPAFTFGELEIQGLERYPVEMIASRNPIRPGDPYNQEKLSELQARLQDTGYFRSAFATVEIDPTKPHHAPVRLDLVENPRRRLSLGGGFSTDTGARGQAKWLDRHFLQRDWRLESELRVDRETGLLSGEVFLPPLHADWLPQGWLPSFGARYERTTISGETDDKIRTGARLVSPNRMDEKTWAVNFLADRQRVGDTFINNRQALIASFIYTKRRLDHPLTPRRGYVASVELGAGPRGVINQRDIARVVARGLVLVPLMPRWRGVLRGNVGQVFGTNRLDIPGDLLFRTGGDQSVRGFSYNSLGVQQAGAVVGGKVTAVVSAEVVYQFMPQWGAAVFTDAGNATDSWRDFKFERGSGIGVRWRSPIGPVNLDVARNHTTNKPRLHFSVGYGF